VKFAYLRLRTTIEQLPGGSGLFNGRDTFQEPDYDLHEVGQLVRIRHSSGAQVVVPVSGLLHAVPVAEQQQGQQQAQKHGGRR
jgi:hypothetical protein